MRSLVYLPNPVTHSRTSRERTSPLPGIALLVGGILGIGLLLSSKSASAATLPPGPGTVGPPPQRPKGLPLRGGQRWYLFGDKTVGDASTGSLVGLQVPLNTRSQSIGAVLTSRPEPNALITDWANATTAPDPGQFDIMVASLGTMDRLSVPTDLPAMTKKLADRVKATGATFVWLLPPALVTATDAGSVAVRNAILTSGAVVLTPPPIAIGGDGYPDAAGYETWANDAFQKLTLPIVQV